jgi:large subunit ribosomal protein L25
MAKHEFILEAKSRKDVGKGASRRLRRKSGEIPAIIYGAGQDPASITMRHDDMLHAVEHEAFFSSIIEIKVDGNQESVVLKDLQRHPARPILMHADFLRVRADVALHVNVPLHFINEEKCVGVRLENGQIMHSMNELEISCLPKDLPEYIEVDMLNIHVGDSIHISDLQLPEGVTSIELSHGEENNHTVATVQEIREQVIEETEQAPAAEEDAEDGASKGDDESADDDS